jgi:ATP-dependent Lon protease
MTEPKGYARLLYVDRLNGRVNGAETILVPAHMAGAINDARLALHDRRHRASAWERACVWPERALELAPGDAEAKPSASAPLDSQPPSRAPAPLASPARARSPRPRNSRTSAGHRVTVISEAAITARREDIELRHKYSSSEKKSEQKAMDDLLERGESRMVGLKKNWRILLESLRSDMPNFGPVIDRIEGCCALSEFAHSPLRIPPLLLAGPPGVGKTHFALRLAAVLGVSRFVYALESAETVAVLCGSEKHWGNTEPGELYKLIVQGEFANPVIVLDELDKSSRGTQYRPTNALHAVLEPATARQLRDKSVDLPFDASYVAYIATANRLSKIDASLLSRFELYLIDEPGPRAAVSIARSIVRQTLAELKLGLRFELPCGEVVQQLALLGGPRQMHKVLRAALGRAVHAGRTRVDVTDLFGSGSSSDAGGGHDRVH